MFKWTVHFYDCSMCRNFLSRNSHLIFYAHILNHIFIAEPIFPTSSFHRNNITRCFVLKHLYLYYIFWSLGVSTRRQPREVCTFPSLASPPVCPAYAPTECLLYQLLKFPTSSTGACSVWTSPLLTSLLANLALRLIMHQHNYVPTLHASVPVDDCFPSRCD